MHTMCSLLCVQNPIIFSFCRCDLLVTHLLAEPAQRLNSALHPHSDSGVENKALPDLGDIHLFDALVILFPSVRRDLLWCSPNRVAALVPGDGTFLVDCCRQDVVVLSCALKCHSNLVSQRCTLRKKDLPVVLEDMSLQHLSRLDKL